MPKTLTLPDGRLVVDGLDSTNKFVAKLDRTDFHAGFLCFTYHVSGFVFDLFFPPMIIRAEKNHGSTVVLQIIREFRFGLGNRLSEREQIGLHARIAFQVVHESCRLLDKFVIFVAKRTNPNKPAPFHREGFSIYFKTLTHWNVEMQITSS